MDFFPHKKTDYMLKILKKTLLLLDDLLTFLNELRRKAKPNTTILSVGIKMRFQKMLWNVDWLRNTVMLILAALIVRFLFVNYCNNDVCRN